MKYSFVIVTLLLFTRIAYTQKQFPIWPGAAPGSEQWNWQEQKDSTELPGDLLAYNVVKPTLTYFPADIANANGTAVIVCPGGSFCYLHINTEGADVAAWLNKKGVAVFVLQYRLIRSETQMPIKEKNERAKDTSSRQLVAALIPLAIADAKQAVTYVRAHAADFHVSPERIGIMGFSAGGTLAVAASFNYSTENRPDFVAPIYAYVPPSLPQMVLPDAPPAFICAASDDELHLVPMSITLYNNWLKAGRSAEIHIYSKGGHGFGMNKKQQPSDTWIERFGDWLEVQGLLNK